MDEQQRESLIHELDLLNHQDRLSQADLLRAAEIRRQLRAEVVHEVTNTERKPIPEENRIENVERQIRDHLGKKHQR